MKKIVLLLLCVLLPLCLTAKENWKAFLRYNKQEVKADLMQRLQKYAAQDSHATLETDAIPSTKQQTAFAKNLAKELKHIGAANVQVSKTGIVTAEIPATNNKSLPVLALVAHLDAPPQARAQQPQLHAKYTSGNVILNKAKNISLTEQNSTQLLRAHGHDFLTTNGEAPFGAGSKAGLAIVMTVADYLLGHNAIEHGLIKIVLLPDTFSHAGADTLELNKLGADYALILDGANQGEIATANFAGRSFTITFDGRRDIPLGQAVSSPFTDNLLMASDFHTLLPRQFRPETTAGQQGYIWVENIVSQDSRSTITGQIRAFSDEDLQRLTQQVTQAFNTIKAIYPHRTGAELNFKDQFQNAQAKIPSALVQSVESALRQEEINPKRISVRDYTDFAVLTSRGLPTIGLFTGVFHPAEPIEYVDVDIMEGALRGVLSLLTSDLTALAPAK